MVTVVSRIMCYRYIRYGRNHDTIGKGIILYEKINFTYELYKMAAFVKSTISKHRERSSYFFIYHYVSN